ncbi:MAG: hypothetical protein AAFQ43_09075 [Bacteroidota bacterium]
MRVFQDHLITAVAAAGILLTSSNLQQESARDLLNQTRRQGGQTALAAFADVVSQDVRSIGSGVPTGEPMVLASGEGALSFRGTADATGTARTVAYTWAEVTGADGDTEIRLHRTVDGVARGQSPALTDLSFDLLDARGAETTALDDVRRVRVRAELAPSPDDTLAESAAVKRLAWETEFAPSNLARRASGSDAHPLLSAHVALRSY